MDVHPSFGYNPQGPTTNEPFSPEAIYELRADTNGDLVADIGYRVRFSPKGTGGMTATVRRADGRDATGNIEDGEIILKGVPVSMGRDARVMEAGAYRMFAGWRSDPFFFDAAGALNKFQFTGTDGFDKQDVCTMAIELPNTDLGNGKGVNLWHRSLVQEGGRWVQAERGAKASQTPFLAGEGADREAYLAGEPAQDQRFVANFAHELEHTGGYTPEGAQAAARTLLPDILPYNPTRPVAYPSNGRMLTDDAVDVFLRVLTNGKVQGDKVGPHTDLLKEFPYVGTPHAMRS